MHSTIDIILYIYRYEININYMTISFFSMISSDVSTAIFRLPDPMGQAAAPHQRLLELCGVLLRGSGLRVAAGAAKDKQN